MTRFTYLAFACVSGYFAWKTRIPFVIGFSIALWVYVVFLFLRREVTHRILRGRGTGGR